MKVVGNHLSLPPLNNVRACCQTFQQDISNSDQFKFRQYTCWAMTVSVLTRKTLLWTIKTISTFHSLLGELIFTTCDIWQVFCILWHILSPLSRKKMHSSRQETYIASTCCCVWCYLIILLSGQFICTLLLYIPAKELSKSAECPRVYWQ